MIDLLTAAMLEVGLQDSQKSIWTAWRHNLLKLNIKQLLIWWKFGPIITISSEQFRVKIRLNPYGVCLAIWLPNSVTVCSQSWKKTISKRLQKLHFCKF